MVSGSIRETVPSRSPATQIAFGADATAAGGPSSTTFARNERSPGSIRATASLLMAAIFNSPSGQTAATPAATAATPTAAMRRFRGRARRQAARPVGRRQADGAAGGVIISARLEALARVLGQRTIEHGVERGR